MAKTTISVRMRLEKTIGRLAVCGAGHVGEITKIIERDGAPLFLGHHVFGLGKRWESVTPRFIRPEEERVIRALVDLAKHSQHPDKFLHELGAAWTGVDS